MRFSSLCGALLLLTSASNAVLAQQQLAVPTTVRAILQSPPSAGRLVMVRGILQATGKDAVLRDENTGHKIDLDFSQSTVPLDALMASGGKPPVELTGRMAEPDKNGRPMLTVVGATSLTP